MNYYLDRIFIGLICTCLIGLTGCDGTTYAPGNSINSGYENSITPSNRDIDEESGHSQAEVIITEIPDENTNDSKPDAPIFLTQIEENAAPDLRLTPERWKEWPVIPETLSRVPEIYTIGQQKGNDPHAFSKIGDCQAIKQVLLGIYDQPERYQLSELDHGLQQIIDYYAGSFNRDGMAVKGGFNAASVLSPFWADPEVCKPGENPQECEFREHRPSIVIISLEVWWEGRTIERYEEYMRKIIEYSIDQGVVPVLSTKADNVEGDHSINLATAKLAYEYNVPLWNFWLATQSLPYQGIDPNRDGFHITTEAWNVRSYTALQVIGALWETIQTQVQEENQTNEENNGQADLTAKKEINIEIENKAVEDIDLGKFYSKGTLHIEIESKLGQSYTHQGVYGFDFSGRKHSTDLKAGNELRYLSPDGELLIFNRQSNLFYKRNGEPQEYLVSEEFYSGSENTVVWMGELETIVFINTFEGRNTISFFNISEQSVGKIQILEAEQPINIYSSGIDNELFIKSRICYSDSSCEPDKLWKFDLNSSTIENTDLEIDSAVKISKKYIAYSHNNHMDESVLAIHFMEKEISRDVSLPGEHLVDFSWSPGGDKLVAFVMERSNYTGRTSKIRIFIIDPVTLGIREYTAINGLNMQHTWSPDGNTIVTVTTILNENGTARLFFRMLNTRSKEIYDLKDKLYVSASEFISASDIYWNITP